MNRDKIFKAISCLDISDIKFSMDKASSALDEFLQEYKIKDEEVSLFKAILLSLGSASSIKNEIIRVLKPSVKNTDLSAALLVDVDSRYELLLAHSLWLLDNCQNSEFDSKLRYGVRLSEEFFSDLVYKVSKLQRTLATELGESDPSVKSPSLLTLVRNMNDVNTFLSELLGKLPGRYDALAKAMLVN